MVDALNAAIDRREEGLVLKDPDSVYRPNARTRGGWIKVKPEYSGGLCDQCDLVIMGGYFGTGRKGGGIVSHFLLGVAVDEGEQVSRINGCVVDPVHMLPEGWKSIPLTSGANC